MATLSHSDSTRLYSWWWDSHVPKNSKWLQDNLTDMDTKVKAMIKLIEEDADSFARRAEMYYKKRPELMKLVEEIYRAYRALAERYDHMTGELRHTQRTIAATFPNQLPFVLDEEGFARSSVSDTEPHSPDVSVFLRALLGRQENHDENSESGLEKDLNYDATRNLSSENENLKAAVFSESQRAVKAENEIQELSKTIAVIQDEKEGIFRQYQICLNKLSNMESDLHRIEKDAVSLCEQKFRAESEVQTIKQALFAMFADFEGLVSCAKSNQEVLTVKVVKTESESQYLTDEICVLVSEKKGNARAYELCQKKIDYLKSKLLVAEENVKLFEHNAESAEIEADRLRRSLAELTVEKECINFQYKNSVKTILGLDAELSRSQENIEQLNTELQTEATKRKDSEKKCIMLEISRQSLRQEADDLAKKLAKRDDELSRNHDELMKLEASLQDEHVRYTQIEANLQIIRSQAQEDHKALAMELETGFQMLKNMEIRKLELEDEVELIKDENRNLQEEKVSIKNLQNENFYLKMMKTRLEEEIIQQSNQTSCLEQELSSSIKEISGLNQQYQDLIEKLESVGLNPDTIETYVKNLRDENSCLRHLPEQMEEVSKKNNVLENSLSQLHSQLESSRKEVGQTEETNRLLFREKSALFAEKTALLMQLHTVTENLQKALGNNAIFENSLSDAKIELAGLREKSKGFEEICYLLKNEKSDLLIQRANLVSQLEIVERRIEFMENKYEALEEKYVDLEKVNKYLQSEIQDLTLSISLEKQERSNTVHRHETLLVSAEQNIHLLQEENRWTMKEYEDELDKAGSIQIELFVLHKFIQDMETKNTSLLRECGKHVEASKLAENLISELERENLEQEVEVEHFIAEIEKLRLGIYRIFKVLEADSKHAFQEKIAHEQNSVHHIIQRIEEMKLSVITYKDEKQLLQVENTVLSTLLSQIASEGIETKSKNEYLEERLNIAMEKLVKVQNDKDSLLDINTVLKSQLEKGNEKLLFLQVDMDSVSTEHREVEKAYLDLFENYFQLLDENRCLLFERSELDEEKGFLEGENDGLLLETLALTTSAMVLERALHDLIGMKDELEMDMNILKEKKIESKQENNTFLLEMEMLGVKDVLRQREDELVEADWNFRAEEEINTELANNLVALKVKFHELSLSKQTIEHQLLEISEDNCIQHKEIEGLREVNVNLASELSKLRKECEDHSAAMDAKDVEFDVWEGEAAAVFYFELQMSSIHGAFYESKVHELTQVFENLEDLTVSRFREIQEMKGKIDSLETEIRELKTELSAYALVIASLKDDVTSLEHNALLHTKLTASGDLALKSARGLKYSGATLNIKPTDDRQNVRIGIQDLQKLGFRIKAVEKTMAEEVKKQGKEELTHSKLAINVVKSPDSKRETLAFKKGSLMKDILLDQISESQSHRLRRRSNSATIDRVDVKVLEYPSQRLRRRANSATIDRVDDKVLESPSQRLRRRANNATIDRVDDKVLELWQIAEDNNNGLHRAASLKKNPSFTSCKIEQPSNIIDVSVDQEASNKKILEKLASDARRLTSLQLTVENLKKKLDSNQKHKKAKDVDIDTVKKQLLEVQETVFELVELNKKLMGNFEGSPFHEKRSVSIIKRNKVSEQARKGSEKIGRLQVEVSKMEYIMQKLQEEEEKKKNMGKSRFIKNKTTIILRDFIYSGRKNSGKKKKSRICGCFRSSSSSHGQNQM